VVYLRRNFRSWEFLGNAAGWLGWSPPLIIVHSGGSQWLRLEKKSTWPNEAIAGPRNWVAVKVGSGTGRWDFYVNHAMQLQCEVRLLEGSAGRNCAHADARTNSISSFLC
jgi:hypothetical protein